MRGLLTLGLVGVGIAWTAGAACTVESVTFTGVRDEDCSTEGDEDANGAADCADPACADAAECVPRCGNGRVELDEACDDGNATNGDGCETTCEVTGSARYPATADAMIRITLATADADANFGAEVGLSTYGSSFGTVARSLVAFDLSALPPGTEIRAAHLHMRTIEQAGVEYAVEVREVEAPWEEAVVTWNTQPAFGANVEASLAYQVFRRWRFDVTALVQRWVDDPAGNHGLALTQDPETFASGGQFVRFDSREGTDRPYLAIIVGD